MAAKRDPQSELNAFKAKLKQADADYPYWLSAQELALKNASEAEQKSFQKRKMSAAWYLEELSEIANSVQMKHGIKCLIMMVLYIIKAIYMVIRK